jgi:UDPglucose 6-dehydrogenase
VTVTDDHPFVVVDGRSGVVRTRLARDLTEADWIPIAQGSASADDDAELVGALRIERPSALTDGDGSLALRADVRESGAARRAEVPGATADDDSDLGASDGWRTISDAIWDRPVAEKRELLARLWVADGSWSHGGGGSEVLLEYSTASPRLADGILRLLGECGIVARMKVGRTAKSTCDTYWLMISGADQVETMLDLVPEADTPAIRASIAAQAKRIAPTGFRRGLVNGAVARVTSVMPVAAGEMVYSLEVPGAHTFVTTGGLVVHNCFPKDVRALKQLAGNSGYHFQLLTAVIEVNELQKRRVISKLQHHLGSLRDTKIALLGIAFKPNTDDTREASSLVLASRLTAEGAEVRAYDPVASGAHLEAVGAIVVSSPAEALAGADAAVIVTEWNEFRAVLDPAMRDSMARPLLIDGRNLLDPAEAAAAGFEYDSVGRPRRANEVAPA